MKAQPRSSNLLLVGLGLVLLLYVALMVAGSITRAGIMAAQDLNASPDAITAAVEVREGRSVLLNVIRYLNPALAWLAALLGAAWSVLRFQDEKRREREAQSRQESQEREEQKRRDTERTLKEMESSLASIWTGLSSEKEGDRSASIARLLFLIELSVREPVDDSMKLQIASALAHAGRQDNSKETIETLTPVVVRAFCQLGHGIISRVSWQGLHLIRPDFSAVPRGDLTRLNFREAILEDASFVGCDLSWCSFELARLNGTDFNHADLSHAALPFADLAGVSLVGARLVSADLRRALWENADLRDADFDKAKLSEFIEPWRLTKNWRLARNLRPQLRTLLEETYGRGDGSDSPWAPRILMIAWEFPPFVSGGGWTAVYHLIFNLIRRGCRVTLVTPWPKEHLDFTVLGNEVEVISVHEKEATPLSLYTSAYVGAYSGLAGGVYAGAASYDAAAGIGHRQREDVGRERSVSIVGVAERFAEKFAEWVRNTIETDKHWECPFDVIYSHDWLCAPAARATLEALRERGPNVRWLAQFHSLEQERQEPGHRSRMIEAIEGQAAREADVVVAVSRRTAARVTETYGRADVSVLPNYVSPIDKIDRPSARKLGDFDSKVVVYIGRLSWQKGPDIFTRLAPLVRDRSRSRTKPRFLMYGEGPMERELGEMLNGAYPQQPIHVRGVSRTESRVGRMFDRIEPVDSVVDLEGQGLRIVERYGELSTPRARLTERALGETGFVAYRLQGERPYTHLVRMKTANGGFDSDYLVESDSLPPPKYLRGRPVELMGGIQWRDRMAAFDGATVVVVPSRFEPFGLVIAEAILWGVPVVYTEEAGIAEILREREGARSVDDLAGMADDISDLLESYDRWERVLEVQGREAEALRASHALDDLVESLTLDED